MAVAFIVMDNDGRPRRLVLPLRGGADVGAGQTEVAVLDGGEVLAGGCGADGEARGLPQLEVEALGTVGVARHGLAVGVPVFAVGSCR